MKHRQAVMGLADVWPACDDGIEIWCACVRQGELVTPYETHATGFRSPHIPLVPRGIRCPVGMNQNGANNVGCDKRANASAGTPLGALS